MTISMRSLRFQLLAAVNVAIALLFGIFLIVDYRREVDDRVAEKHIALEEEAKTLLPAVVRMRPYGEEAVQGYVDEVCGKMQEAPSPGHHIVVRLNETVIQAAAHHRASAEILEAMRAAARSSTYRAPFGEEELVVGSTRQGDAVAYVSEYLSDIRASARRQVLGRLPRIILLLVVTAIIVNVVFLRMAAGPLRQLVHTVRQVGEGKLGAQAGPFKSEEFAYLADAINSMSSALAETERQRRFEMDRARSIQEQLLPHEVKVPGLDFAHLYLPAEDVAGDYCDMIPLPGGACLACIADVSGHGVAAALSATMLKAFLLDASEHHSDPGEILGFINHRLAVVCQTDNFVTMFVARCDREAKTLEYASAGHESGLLMAATGEITTLPSTGLVLGIMEDAVWETETRELDRGDRLLLVTDGVTEAMNREGELFGRQRLVDTFEACKDSGVNEVSRLIGHVVAEHCAGRSQNDDVTLLALEATGGVTPKPADGL